jgi:Na+/H+ antiporter NhaD/arsenite permease-like protein
LASLVWLAMLERMGGTIPLWPFMPVGCIVTVLSLVAGLATLLLLT